MIALKTDAIDLNCCVSGLNQFQQPDAEEWKVESYPCQNNSLACNTPSILSWSSAELAPLQEFLATHHASILPLSAIHAWT